MQIELFSKIILKNRIAEVAIQNGELYCLLCEEKDCVHVGYVFGLPDVYEVLNAKGIKQNKNNSAGGEIRNSRTPERRDHPFL